MITKRIIPCLDVKNGRVVKGVNFQGLADVSDPVELAAFYSAAGATNWCSTTSPPPPRAAPSSPTCSTKVAATVFIPPRWGAVSTRWRILPGAQVRRG